MLIDQKSRDFIIAQEVTSPAYYGRHYRKPEWPGVSSGITIGCGYDLGYASRQKITEDWGKHVSSEMLATMCLCSGVKGDAAKALLPSVKNKIDIPWEAAVEVFDTRDIPQWTGAVQRALPNTDKISARCLGMLVSTAYNRGVGGFTSTTGDRYLELRNIRFDMAQQTFAMIGKEFRSMRRLWPGVKGLQNRYAQTADIWDEGLKLPALGHNPDAFPPVTHDGEDPLKSGPARTKPPATVPAQHGTAGAVVAGGAAASHVAAANGAATAVVIAIVVFAAVAAAGIWYAWYRNRNPK
jgi:hypothetical protein